MEPFIYFLITAASTGAAVITSRVTTRKTTHRTQWRKMTPAEKFAEQKELSRFLVMEVAQLNNTDNIPKEKIDEILNQLQALYDSASLGNLTMLTVNDCMKNARLSLQVSETINRRYVAVLAKLVDAIASGVVRAAGGKEIIQHSMRTMHMLQGVASDFRAYSAGAVPLDEWKNEANKKRPKS